jgi:DhnA family fructose-bisphosphate aldolase class Ia
MEQARDAGAIGYSVGRNVFEHASAEAMTRALTSIFKSGVSAKQALKELRDELGTGKAAV